MHQPRALLVRTYAINLEGTQRPVWVDAVAVGAARCPVFTVEGGRQAEMQTSINSQNLNEQIS